MKLEFISGCLLIEEHSEIEIRPILRYGPSGQREAGTTEAKRNEEHKRAHIKDIFSSKSRRIRE